MATQHIKKDKVYKKRYGRHDHTRDVSVKKKSSFFKFIRRLKDALSRSGNKNTVG